MQSATGVVERAGDKTFKGRTYFNFSLVDDDTLYRTGTTDYGLKSGDQIEFDYEVSNYGTDVKSVKVTGNVPVEKNKAKTSAGKAAAKASKGNSREDFWSQKAEDDKARQITISYQAANKTAVDVVKLALEQDAISLGSAKAKKMGALMAVIDEVTNEIFEKYQNAGSHSAEKAEVPDETNNNSLDD